MKLAEALQERAGLRRKAGVLADRLAKELRLADNALQKANWETDLVQ